MSSYSDIAIEECPVCGTDEPVCGYDDTGRPYVHTELESYDVGPAIEDVDTGGLT